MASIIGIDLGTTNSVIAYLDESGEPRVHKVIMEGDSIVPSAVRIEGDQVIVGREAIRLKDQGMEVWTGFKRDIGTGKVYGTTDSMEITPESLSTFVLKKLVSDFANDHTDPIVNTVITYPANFTDESREATLSAGKLADLPVELCINEPTAAALYFAVHENIPMGKYAVYDFGGGTWDISVIEIHSATVEEGGVSVIDSDGIAQCGGSDFDMALRELVESKFRDQTDIEIDYGFPIHWEELKKSLSISSERNQVVRGVDGVPVTLTVTRAEFEKSISHLLAQTELICQSMFEKHPDIVDVLLVGGSGRVPAVRESVAKVFGKQPLTLGNPDEVVALGAAVYSGLKTDSKNLNSAQAQLLSNVKFNEITNHDFGLLTFGHNPSKGQDEDRISYIIDRGSSIPCSKTKPFYTISDNQPGVDLKMYQSKNAETNKRYAQLVGETELGIPPGLPRGEQIDVTFSFDEGGMMHCDFVHTKSGSKEKISITPQFDVDETSKKEIDFFKVE